MFVFKTDNRITDSNHDDPELQYVYDTSITFMFKSIDLILRH